MKLWSDYEGRTIAEVYPLKKLLRPEGRSAFFLTTNGTGTPSLVRVIEAHFDESEILGRWRTVSGIEQENLVTMRKFGETELDGTPLLYAVMEPTEISLDELLENRTMTPEEARQLAGSMLGALQALHARNLVHGHIEPANILAAGETVKLRSDCVREAVDDPDGAGPSAVDQKAADAHALAIVLLQALTGRTSLQGSATLLPSPFDGIIRNGLSGKWGLAEMAAALGPIAPAQVAASVRPAPTLMPAAPQPLKPSTTPAVAVKSEAATPKAEMPAEAKPEAAAPAQVNLFAQGAPASAAARPAPVSATSPAHATSPQSVAASLDAATATRKMPAPPEQAPDVRHRIVRPLEAVGPRNSRLWVAAVVAVLLLLFFGWRLMRSEPAARVDGAAKAISTLAEPDPGEKTPTAPAAATAAAPTAKPSAVKLGNGRSATVRPPAVNPATSPTSPKPSASVPAGAAGRTQWRVVAFTYNHEDQARQKADSIAKQHPSLNPEVFSPSGHAPYLVTVGGPMSRDQAQAFKQKARDAGLPRDLYAQNYTR